MSSAVWPPTAAVLSAAARVSDAAFAADALDDAAPADAAFDCAEAAMIENSVSPDTLAFVVVSNEGVPAEAMNELLLAIDDCMVLSSVTAAADEKPEGTMS